MKSLFSKYQLVDDGLHSVEWRPGTPRRIKEAYKGFIKEQNEKHYLRGKNQASAGL